MMLFLIRHGETDKNSIGLTHAANDEQGLNKVGKKQAYWLASALRKYKVKYIITSPERRALETAKIIAKENSTPMDVYFNLHERDWGTWEGKPWEEIDRELSKMSIDERYAFVPSGGESWRQMEKRLQETLQTVRNLKEDRVAVITHEGALRGLMPLLTHEPRIKSLNYHFENGSLTVFEITGDRYKQIVVNDISHLR